MTAWPLARLGELITLRKEFIQINDSSVYKRCRVQLHAQGIVLRDEVPGIEIKTKAQQVCRSGEFLVAEIDAKVGGFGIIPPDLDGAIVSSHYFLFAINPSLLDAHYLGLYVRTAAFRDQVTAQGSTNYAAIRPSHVLNYTIPLPPLHEQRRIVERLDDIQSKVQTIQQFKADAEAGVRSLLVAYLNSRLGTIRHDATVGDMLIGKPRNGWSARCDNVDGGTAVLSLGAVTGFEYRPDQHKLTSEAVVEDAHYWLRDGDLLITRSNTPDLVGHAAIYNGHPFPCIYPDLMMRLEVDESLADKRFLQRWLMGDTVRRFISKAAKGTSPTMKKISQGVVMRIPFPCLSLVEQQRLADQIESVRLNIAEATLSQSEVAKTIKALMPSVLNAAFSGQL